jgi:hypothetical protein
MAFMPDESLRALSAPASSIGGSCAPTLGKSVATDRRNHEAGRLSPLETAGSHHVSDADPVKPPAACTKIASTPCRSPRDRAACPWRLIQVDPVRVSHASAKFDRDVSIRTGVAVPVSQSATVDFTGR